MKTKFAPAEREEREKIILQTAKIENSEFLDRVMASTPLMFFILNDKRQTVYSNKLLMKYLGYEQMEMVTGNRPGEMFDCIHAENESGGCGTTENCRYCGAVNAILDSKKSNELEIRECILNIITGGQQVAMNFEVSSKPFEWEGEEFYVITLQNIAEKKRKEQLERTFFHDITNKAGNVKMFLEIIGKKYVQAEDSGMFDMVKQGLSEMLEDIQYQRKLQQAEEGELIIEPEALPAEAIMQSVVDEYQSLANSYEVSVKYEPPTEELSLESDKVLLKRILGNLVKNAIEASEPGHEIVMLCGEMENRLIFSVKNPAVMPEEIKMQLFNRSFSTKGEGRGIGTYSVKLFTEHHLKGNVEFTSQEGVGTEFRIILPLSLR